MASSPEFIRLATSSSRALADTALDSLCDAVVIVDARHKPFLVVLANAAARRTLIEESDIFGLIESPLFRWMSPVSAAIVEHSLTVLSDHHDGTRRTLEWRCATGEISFITDIKPLVSSPGQRLIMLTFARATPELQIEVGLGPHLEFGLAETTDAGAMNAGWANSDEHRLLPLTEGVPDIIKLSAAGGKLRYVSGGVRNSLGNSSEEREWICSSALENPLVGGVMINSRDITERRLAESRLAQREELFRLAADAMDGVIYEWDVARGFVHRSRGVMEVLGLEPDDLEPTISAWYARIHPKDFEVAKKAVNLGLLTGRGWTTTYRIRDTRGRYRSMLERGLIQRNVGGDPVRAICCCVDVSEIKRVTDLLAETQRSAKMGGWEYSYVTRELTWTDEMYRIYETSPEQFEVSWDTMLAQCTPESLRLFNEACDRSEATDSPLDLELEITTLMNQRIWVRVIGHVELLEGRPFRAFGSVQNVQAQKLAQIALETSTGWLKLSMNMAHMHAWRWDRTQDMLEFATEHSVGGQRVQLPILFPGMKKFMARVHPGDRQAVSGAIDHAFQCETEVQKEFRLKSAGGRYHWYAAIAQPLFDAVGTPRGLGGVIQNVTARRDSEARLRRSEELLRATTANAADMLVLLDMDLKVRFINRGVGALSIEAIIGREIGALLPEPARAGVLEKLRHILDTGETATYEFESAEDGEVRYFENRAVLVRDAGVGPGISISTRDITERKHLEQEILDVSGRERQSIGRDLHDGLGQELTGVALMLRALGARVQGRCPEALDSVNEIVALVNRSIENARSLARGLLPVRTETGGLACALRELASRSRDLYGLDVNFTAEVAQDWNLDETNASHLYRIAQEALTNASRHGHATLVDIHLQATNVRFSLSIKDNGEGFHLPTSHYSGMGLKIMKYRAGMIGAKFEISPNEPRGTVVRVTGEQPTVAGIKPAPVT